MYALGSAALVSAVIIGAQASLAVPDRHIKRSRGFELCKPFTWRTVHGPWGSYNIRNAVFWPGQGVRRATFCVKHSGGVPSFHVSRSDATPLLGSEPAAYPELFSGCVHGSCSPHSILPQQVRHLQHVRVSTYYRLTRRSRGGKWDASFDIWFAKHDRRNGQPTAAELMLWLVNRRVRYFPEWSIRVHGIKWLAEEWRTHNKVGQSWPLIIFERAHPDGHVKRLPLRPFMKFAEKHRWLKPSLWMTSIASGFEVWNRGRGLGIKFFRIFHS